MRLRDLFSVKNRGLLAIDTIVSDFFELGQRSKSIAERFPRWIHAIAFFHRCVKILAWSGWIDGRKPWNVCRRTFVFIMSDRNFSFQLLDPRKKLVLKLQRIDADRDEPTDRCNQDNVNKRGIRQLVSHPEFPVVEV